MMYAAEKTMDADFALSQAIINRPNKTLPLSLPFIAQYCPNAKKLVNYCAKET